MRHPLRAPVSERAPSTTSCNTVVEVQVLGDAAAGLAEAGEAVAVGDVLHVAGRSASINGCTWAGRRAGSSASCGRVMD